MNRLASRDTLKKIRSIGTFWAAEQTLNHLKAIREYELGLELDMLPPTGKLLEIGAGTGWQANILQDKGYDVSAIDIPESNYAQDCVRQITRYDGRQIPYEDDTFDIIFSSNVLEHIPHLREFQNEIHRVLKPDGCVLHILPSGSWRFWASITHLLRQWTIPKPHGEHAGNALAEMCYFSKRWWINLFHETGWIVAVQTKNSLFYSGYSIMDSRISIPMRKKMSRFLGSSCNIFLLRHAPVTSCKLVETAHNEN